MLAVYPRSSRPTTTPDLQAQCIHPILHLHPTSSRRQLVRQCCQGSGRRRVPLVNSPPKLKRHPLLLEPHINPILSSIPIRHITDTEQTEVERRLVHTVRHSRDIPAGHIRRVRDSHALQACLVRKVNVDDLGAAPDSEHLSPDLRAEDGVVELAEVVVLATQTVIVLDGVRLVEHVKVPARAVGAGLGGAELQCASSGACDGSGIEILTQKEGLDDDVGSQAFGVQSVLSREHEE